MKKTLLIILALALSCGSQAQIGNLVGGAVRKSVEKKISQTVEDKMDAALGNKKSNNVKTTRQTIEQQENESHIPTPEEVMDMVPMPPSFESLSDYACESNRANTRMLKLATNPTAKYIARMATAMASGYVTMMGNSKTGSVYYYDEQLLAELGVSQEQYDAMSEEEQEKLAQKYASELKERYIRSAEWLSSNEEYVTLQKRYNEIEKEIDQLYSEAETQTAKIWKDNYAAKGEATEADMCSYFKEAVPIIYKAVNVAMEKRRGEQLPIAKEMDAFVQKMAKEHPGELYAGFFNQGGVCATAYVGDAARLTSFSDPR